MNALLALSIIFLIYAIGESIADKTKAFISMLLACAIIFTLAFWAGLPKDAFAKAGLVQFADLTICTFLIHIGTTIQISDFIKEWKTVIVSFCGATAVALGVFFIGRYFIDYYYALVGAPVLAGGVVAYLVMSPISDLLSRPDIKVFAVLVFQNFVGVPVASYFCKKEGDRVRNEFVAGTLATEDAQAHRSFRIFRIPEKYSTPYIILFKLFVISYISSLLARQTGLSILIFGLIFGIICHEIGLVEEKCLEKANAFTFVMAGALAQIFSGLSSTTPAMLLDMILPLLLVFLIGTISCCIVATIVGKIVHFDWKMSIAMAVTAFFGFPGTYLISQEVAHACGHTEEERAAVLAYIMPKLVIAGIVSVSVVSGLLASIMVNWI